MSLNKTCFHMLSSFSLKLLSFYQLWKCASSQTERQITEFAQIVSFSSKLVTIKTPTTKPTQTNKQTKNSSKSLSKPCLLKPLKGLLHCGEKYISPSRSSLRLIYHRNLEFWFCFVNWDGGLRTLNTENLRNWQNLWQTSSVGSITANKIIFTFYLLVLHLQ